MGLIGLAGCTEIIDRGGDGIQDTDGDGVIDSEDYAPRDPSIQRKEQLQETEISGQDTDTPKQGTTTSEQASPSDELDAPFSTSAPTIDGTIESTEWRNAASYDLTFRNFHGEDPHEVTVYLMHDGHSLFIGIDNGFADGWDNHAGVQFDRDHDHERDPTRPHNDLVFGYPAPSGWPGYKQYKAPGGPQYSPPGGLNRASGAHSGTVHYEYKIPLADSLRVSPGGTVGIHFRTHTPKHGKGERYYWPITPQNGPWKHMDRWPDLRVAPGRTTPASPSTPPSTPTPTPAADPPTEAPEPNYEIGAHSCYAASPMFGSGIEITCSLTVQNRGEKAGETKIEMLVPSRDPVPDVGATRSLRLHPGEQAAFQLTATISEDVAEGKSTIPITLVVGDPIKDGDKVDVFVEAP